MNIVFVSKECPPSPRSCGIGTYVWETGRALADLGHEVTIVSASDSDQSSVSSPLPHLTLIRLPDDELTVEHRNIFARTLHAPLEQGITYRARVADCLAELCKGQRPDVIEFPGYRGESLMWATRRSPIPLVVRLHGGTGGIGTIGKDRLTATGRLRLAWERKEIRAADLITVVSEYQAKLFRSFIAPDRMRVIHNSIDTTRWGDLAASAPVELEPKDVLFVGSLLMTKGIFALLRAANSLRRDGWRGRLVLAGRSTPQFERFIWRRTHLGKTLPDWILRLGVCPRDRLAGLYHSAGVCCFPSLVEAFSYTGLEAMASGGIVVGSSLTGMAEVVDQGSGILVDPRKISELVSALKCALSMNKTERNKFTTSARRRVHGHFDRSIIAPQLIATYSKLAGY